MERVISVIKGQFNLISVIKGQFYKGIMYRKMTIHGHFPIVPL